MPTEMSAASATEARVKELEQKLAQAEQRVQEAENKRALAERDTASPEYLAFLEQRKGGAGSGRQQQNQAGDDREFDMLSGSGLVKRLRAEFAAELKKFGDEHTARMGQFAKAVAGAYQQLDRRLLSSEDPSFKQAFGKEELRKRFETLAAANPTLENGEIWKKLRGELALEQAEADRQAKEKAELERKAAGETGTLPAHLTREKSATKEQLANAAFESAFGNIQLISPPAESDVTPTVDKAE